MTIMTPEHPHWNEFITELAGPDACNFEEIEGKFTWSCGGGTNKDFAERILSEMGFVSDAIAASLAYFEDHGGYCDCEILFNVAGPLPDEG